MTGLLNPSKLKRFLLFFIFDSVIIAVSLYLSFFIRFDYSISSNYYAVIYSALPFFLAVKLVSFVGFRLYQFTWRFVGLRDLFNIFFAVSLSGAALFLVFRSITPLSIPRSIFLIDFNITFLLICLLRISKRLYLEVFKKDNRSQSALKTLIIGAGNTGEMIIRDMARQGFADFYPVALLDDNPTKVGAYIHGIKVFGATDDLKKAIIAYSAEAVIIAIPSLNHKVLMNIHSLAKENKIGTVKIVPRIYDFHKPDINLKSLEDIHIEDLIGRQAVEVNYDEIEIFLQNTCVLITGAGGSIGSEIAMQVCAFQPQKVILFDIDETDLHNMHLKLTRVFPHLKEKLFFITGDIRDEGRIEEVFKTFRPQLVFHSAAYKHVPMMEYNPKEAVKVNMLGTYLLARSSVKYGIKKFILISTDKAVMPTSVMGATKRMAEYICKAFNDSEGQRNNPLDPPLLGGTEFISVRFGNVLGSRGSVLPLFLEQLKYGGPLTVTHRDMQRYFMTIPEAVSLVLQASVIGKAGDVLVLDMGEPVKIVELAEELIRIHGMEPYKDVDIEFIGLRPGEKLFEEILTAEEGTVASKHERVFIAKNSEKYSMEEIENILKEFDRAIKESPAVDGRRVRALLKKYVRHFNEN
ncbi:MAG: nucleoside-diphosphate sugar epimerase/dehydratase [Nitrospirota bacterium]|nr:nucleoside-diphosphate sugar epimerase/dehydratase [Nitrospirota bacterium]